MKLKIVIAILIILVLVRGCSHYKPSHASHSAQRVVTVQPAASQQNALYYAGVIEPFKSTVVTSPADGVVESMAFHYGDTVAAGQLLFIINSEKFQSDYKTALTQYLKAKNDYEGGRNQLKQGQFLHDNQLISDDDFKARQTNFYSAQLSFLQTKDTLAVLLKQLDVKEVNLYDLSIADIDKIDTAMHLQEGAQKLHIKAPVAGMVLLPVKTEANAQKKLLSGDAVKQGDLLGLVADKSGFSIRINVNELDINQIKLGQKVRVTGSAFPEDVLEGEVTGIDHQAEVNSSGSPSFAVEVTIPQLTLAQQTEIHVGMSAKVEVNVDEESHLSVPIVAVKEKNGSAYVSRLNPKTKRYEDVAIRTGKTSAADVVVLDNLQPGDQIAYFD